MYEYIHSDDINYMFDVYTLLDLHRMLFKTSPHPECAGTFRNFDVYLPGTGTDLSEWSMIRPKLEEIALPPAAQGEPADDARGGPHVHGGPRRVGGEDPDVLPPRRQGARARGGQEGVAFVRRRVVHGPRAVEGPRGLRHGRDGPLRGRRRGEAGAQVLHHVARRGREGVPEAGPRALGHREQAPLGAGRRVPRGPVPRAHGPRPGELQRAAEDRAHAAAAQRHRRHGRRPDAQGVRVGFLVGEEGLSWGRRGGGGRVGKTG